VNTLQETVELVDLGLGNLNSIATSLLRSGIGSRRLRPEMSPRSKILILPGIGNFDSGAKALDSNNFRELILKHIANDGALIGVCLGMQLLGKSSEEGRGRGLGLLDYDTTLLGKEATRSAPVMGWRTPKIIRHGWLGLNPESRYYFMHDYGVQDAPQGIVTMTHEVSGAPVASSVAQGKIIGFQFHPERSLKFGQEILASAVRELSQ